MKDAMATSDASPSAGSKIISFSIMSCTPFGSQSPRRFDVPGLRALVATAEQDDDRVVPLLKIDAIAGAAVDAQFADPVPDRFHIADEAIGEAIQPGRDQAARPLILELGPPRAESLSL